MNGGGLHITLLHTQIRTHRFQSLQVQINRSGTNGTATRQRDCCMARTRNQRPQHVETRPHLADLIIWRDRAFQLSTVQMTGRIALRPIDFNAQRFQQLRKEARISQIRHIGKRDGLVSQQTCDHQLQSGVLRAGNRNAAIQMSAALDVQFIHGLPLYSASRLWKGLNVARLHRLYPNITGSCLSPRKPERGIHFSRSGSTPRARPGQPSRRQSSAACASARAKCRPRQI